MWIWMYNSTAGSIFIAMIAHLGHNLAANLVPMPADKGQGHLTIALLYFVAAMIVVFATRPSTLLRPSNARMID